MGRLRLYYVYHTVLLWILLGRLRLYYHVAATWLLLRCYDVGNACLCRVHRRVWREIHWCERWFEERGL